LVVAAQRGFNCLPLDELLRDSRARLRLSTEGGGSGIQAQPGTPQAADAPTPPSSI